MAVAFAKVDNVETADEARDLAIAWQFWQSEEALSMLEVAEWSAYFEGLANKFDLTEEFRENGII